MNRLNKEVIVNKLFSAYFGGMKPIRRKRRKRRWREWVNE